MSEPVISRIQLAAAHDGVAELIVTLHFENGGESLVTLDAHATERLLASTGSDDPAALVGASWVHVRDALQGASNRYSETTKKRS